MFDKHERIAGFAEFPAAILTNPRTQDFALVDVECGSSPGERENFARRGLHYAGTVGLVNGVTTPVLDEALDFALSEAVAKAYASHVASKRAAAEINAHAAFETAALTALYEQPEKPCANA